MRKALMMAGAALLLAAARPCPLAQRQDRVRLDLQRPDRRDRQRHAQFVRARARPYGPQDGRPAGRSDLRRRRLQAGCRQAEDREADRVRQGRLHRRLYLVERAAGLAQAGGRFQDLPDQRQCRPVADRRRAVLALRVLDLVAERPDAAGDGPLHEPEGREVGVPDRPELRRRQGHAGGRRLHLQRQGRRRGTHHLAGAARLLGRAGEGQSRQSGRDLRVLSGQGRRAVPGAIRAGGPQGQRSRSTPPSPSTNCRCRCRRSSRSACPARRNG